MAWSNEESRRQAAEMTMRSTMNRDAWEAFTAEERRAMMKDERARRFSGIDRFPSTMEATWRGLMSAVEDNGLGDLWDSMGYRERGAMLVAFKCGYDAGRSDAS